MTITKWTIDRNYKLNESLQLQWQNWAPLLLHFKDMSSWQDPISLASVTDVHLQTCDHRTSDKSVLGHGMFQRKPKAKFTNLAIKINYMFSEGNNKFLGLCDLDPCWLPMQYSWEVWKNIHEILLELLSLQDQMCPAAILSFLCCHLVLLLKFWCDLSHTEIRCRLWSI